MKYTIDGFSQSAMIKAGMDAADAIILRWFVDFSATGKMDSLREESKIYYWICYQNLIEQLPIVGIKNRESLGRRLMKMVESEILIHKHVLNGGSYSYYGFGEKYESLIDDSETIKNEKSEPSDPEVGTPHTQESEPLRPRSRNKDSSIIDSSLKDKKAPSRPPIPKIEPDFEEKIWIGELEPWERHWGDIYPDVNVEREMFSALEYAIAHPEKQYKKWFAFLSNWMRNAQGYAERRNHAS